MPRGLGDHLTRQREGHPVVARPGGHVWAGLRLLFEEFHRLAFHVNGEDVVLLTLFDRMGPPPARSARGPRRSPAIGPAPGARRGGRHGTRRGADREWPATHRGTAL